MQSARSSGSATKPASGCSASILLQRIDELHAPVRRDHMHMELLLFVYHLSHLLVQNFNVYRLNFYNWNFYILFLAALLLGRALFTQYYRSFREENPLDLTPTRLCLNAVVLALLVLNTTYLMTQLFMRHCIKSLIWLFCPLAAHLLFLRGVAPSRLRGAADSNAMCARLKCLLVETIESSYLTGFLPLKFLQHDYLYFDTMRCVLLILFVFVNTLVIQMGKLLSTNFLEFHLSANALGYWRSQGSAANQSSTVKPAFAWSPKQVYSAGACVSHKGKVYSSVGEPGNAEPGSFMPAILFLLFGNAGRTHDLLVVVQLVVVAAHLLILLNSKHWNVYFIMLGFDYYILYCTLYVRRQNLPFLAMR